MRNYATRSEEVIELIARHCRRQYFQTKDHIMVEGDVPDKVCFVVRGQCRVVKNVNRVGERTVNLLGRGSAFGDTNVANEQTRKSSVFAVVSSAMRCTVWR